MLAVGQSIMKARSKMTKGKNFSGQLTPSIIDTHYERCNFSHYNCIDDGGQKKGVRIFPGDDTPRTFENCNLVNVEVPPGSACIKCNRTIRENNLVANINTITIDGFDIEVKEYENRIYGKATDSGYDYFSSIIKIPCETLEN